MNLIEAYSKIHTLAVPALSTADLAAFLRLNKNHTSKILERLAEKNLIFQLRRGIWVFNNSTDPLLLANYLTSPWPAYISLYTALFYHGIISQIPSNIYAVSLSRTKKYKTAFGTFSVHHVPEHLFLGYETKRPNGLKIATAEKALFDLVYLSNTKLKIFKKLPELEFSKKFSWVKIRKFCTLIKDRRKRRLMLYKIEQLTNPPSK